MRLIVSVFIVALVGCGAMEEYSTLDVAPLSDDQLRHPEWAENSTSTANQNAVEGPYGQRRSDNMDSLVNFLSQQGIAYEVLSGGHTMIKLRQKINFNTGSASVSPASQDWLSKLGLFLSGYSNVDIVIDGHTDNTGNLSNNELLSQKRASEVKLQLLNNSIHPNNVFTRGYGEYMPECTNGTNSGKACNRRAELTLILADY
ncbi:OmpA family protein [Vibrio algarum]|uniref:OmpA family protein n=1 Tax=Vibrio algarum TaxID=3020714 RepID=A0ABT4YXU4_9VIBR|nr:OmpA family protein [Vibrio sp. KJ40-1]MDB1126195.1 OmpA family protein [Vibrio sp. KJ40-1]